MYLPRNFLTLYPGIKRPVANAVQSIIESAGVAFVRHVKDAYNTRGWTYGTDVLHTGGGPPGLNRPLIPSPVQNSNKYQFWGYPVDANMAAGANPNMQYGELENVDPTTAAYQLQELTARLLHTEEQLEICQEEISNLQSALTARENTITSLRA